MKSWNLALRSVGAEELEIAVYDIIGQSFMSDGVTAKDILGQLRAAPKSKKINLRVNSVGGIVDEAKAMVNLLNERAADGVEIVATVDGIAASAASYLLTAASKVTMPANAFMMIHSSNTGVRGNASKFEEVAALLRRVDGHLAEAYSAASLRRGVLKSKEDYLAMFAAGDLYLDADQAIALGLADQKSVAMKVAACLVDVELLPDDAPAALLDAPYMSRRAQPPIVSNSESAKFSKGDRVEALVNHMPGMKGMTGAVEIVRTEPPYYGVKFDGETKVHKWLAEDEVKATSASKSKMAPMSGASADNSETQQSSPRLAGQERKNSMTKEELKAQHPALVAELLAEGRAEAASVEPIVDVALAKLGSTAQALTGSKTLAEAEAAIVALAAKNDKLERLEGEVAVLGKERHQARVSQLIGEGKLKPSRKEYFLTASSVDLDQYLVATGGEVLAPVGQEHQQPAVVAIVDGKGVITAQDRAIGKQLDLSDEQLQQAADLRAQKFGK